MLKVLPPFKVLKSVHSMYSLNKNVVATCECFNSTKLTSDLLQGSNMYKFIDIYTQIIFLAFEV